jgi:hypothetical protein
MKSLLNSLFAAKSVRSANVCRPRVQLGVESLEDRFSPSTVSTRSIIIEGSLGERGISVTSGLTARTIIIEGSH